MQAQTLAEVDVCILCGGMGTRLRAAVPDRPKALAEIAGRPFLDILIEHLARQGLRRFILCVGFGADAITRHASHLEPFGEIVLSHEEQPLGTGGALRQALSQVRSDTLLALNGDSICPVDMAALLEFHQTRRAELTLVVAPPGPANDYGSVKVGDDGRILGFGEKTRSKEAFRSAGVYAFSRSFLEAAIPESRFSLETELFPHPGSERAYAFVQPHDFIDIGVPERYREAEQRLRELGLLGA